MRAQGLLKHASDLQTEIFAHTSLPLHSQTDTFLSISSAYILSLARFSKQSQQCSPARERHITTASRWHSVTIEQRSASFPDDGGTKEVKGCIESIDPIGGNSRDVYHAGLGAATRPAAMPSTDLRVILTNDDGPTSPFFDAWVMHVRNRLKWVPQSLISLVACTHVCIVHTLWRSVCGGTDGMQWSAYRRPNKVSFRSPSLARPFRYCVCVGPARLYGACMTMPHGPMLTAARSTGAQTRRGRLAYRRFSSDMRQPGCVQSGSGCKSRAERPKHWPQCRKVCPACVRALVTLWVVALHVICCKTYAGVQCCPVAPWVQPWRRQWQAVVPLPFRSLSSMAGASGLSRKSGNQFRQLVQLQSSFGNLGERM